MKACKEFRGEKCAHLRASASSLRITFRPRNEAFPREMLHFYLTLCAVFEDNDDEENDGRSGRAREQRETALVSVRVARSDRAFTRMLQRRHTRRKMSKMRTRTALYSSARMRARCSKTYPKMTICVRKRTARKSPTLASGFSAKPRANTHRWRWILRTLLMPVMRVMRQVVGGSSEGGEEREGKKRKRGSRTKG